MSKPAMSDIETLSSCVNSWANLLQIVFLVRTPNAFRNSEFVGSLDIFYVDNSGN